MRKDHQTLTRVKAPANSSFSSSDVLRNKAGEGRSTTDSILWLHTCTHTQRPSNKADMLHFAWSLLKQDTYRMETAFPKSNEYLGVFGECQRAGEIVVSSRARQGGLGMLHASGYVIKTERPLTAYACYCISHNTKNRTDPCCQLIQGLCSVQVPSFNLYGKGWQRKY